MLPGLSEWEGKNVKIMNFPVFISKTRRGSFKSITAFLLILIAGLNLFGQYRGQPVKKERLVKAIRLRQLQTRDIVAIINSNGVDFRLTPEIRKTLIAAGARPEVIKAVADNLRLPPSSETFTAKSEKNNVERQSKPLPPNYEELLDQAMRSYRDKNNPGGAVRFLETAVKVRPKGPLAHQMLGFIYLNDLNNRDRAEKAMWDSLDNGGSAVFRVYHDDNGKFTGRCVGSLYISQDIFRFESDDNRHTFETSMGNVDKIRLDHESTQSWKKHSVFKIFLKIGNDKAKFRFAPLNGDEEISKMVGRFIAVSSATKNTVVSVR
jgi:hypothetical protein